MSSKVKHQAAAAMPVIKGHAKAEARKQARQRYARSRGLPWLKISAGAVLALVVGLLAFNFLTTGYGKLTPQSANYAFGDVPWKDGFVTTQFPITVEGDITVNDIVST